MIKAVIFDLDGTLIDTVDSMAEAGNRMLEAVALQALPRDAYKYFAGDGADMLVKRALIAAGDTELRKFSAAKEVYNKLFETYCTYHVCPYDGIPETLQALKERGIKIAVLSNKPHAQTPKVVEAYFGTIFDAVQGQSDTVRKKPSPDGALLIAEKLGVMPEECLYVGDTNVDMQTGNAAGMFTLGVLWGFRTEQELRENNAKVIISEPKEILAYL